MARNVYTDEDKAHAFVALTANGGNVKRTARELNMPVPTLRAWRDAWDKEGGPPAPLIEKVQDEVDQFVEDATRARDLALQKWEQAVRAGDVKGKDLMVGVGILSDKINLAKGLSNRTPAERPAITGAEMRELARGFVEGALEAAREREAEIVEAEVIEQAPRALGPAETKG